MNTLLIVDVQNDFLPTGALPVPRGDEVIPVINRIQECADLILATQDWHPAEHGSFALNHTGRNPGEVIELDGLEQILWPIHCVQNTGGACFAPGLQTRMIARIFQKGTDPSIDSYSGFYDNGRRRSTGLTEWLRERKVRDLWICGLATDYCVKFTTLDALREEFQVTVITDACRGVNLQPGDDHRALLEMEKAGAQLVTSADLEK